MPPKPHLAPPFYPTAPAGDPTVRALPIPGYYQVRQYTCGYACTLMVLHAFRRYVPGVELYERLGTDYTGTSQSAIVRELRREGLSANLRYNLDFDGFARAIDAGKLVVSYHARLEHWVVVYGYGREPGRLYVADPLKNHRAEQDWDTYGQKLRGFGIVCSPMRARSKTSPPSTKLGEREDRDILR